MGKSDVNPDLVPDGWQWDPGQRRLQPPRSPRGLPLTSIPLTSKSSRWQLKRAALIRTLAQRDGWGCKFCLRPLAFDGGIEVRATMDHWVPRSRRKDPHKNHRHPKNLVLACQPCNQIKDDMTGEEFLAIPYEERERLREAWIANLRRSIGEF